MKKRTPEEEMQEMARKQRELQDEMLDYYQWKNAPRKAFLRVMKWFTIGYFLFVALAGLAQLFRLDWGK